MEGPNKSPFSTFRVLPGRPIMEGPSISKFIRILPGTPNMEDVKVWIMELQRKLLELTSDPAELSSGEDVKDRVVKLRRKLSEIVEVLCDVNHVDMKLTEELTHRYRHRLALLAASSATPSRPEITIPNPMVIGGNHGAVTPFTSLPMEGEHARMVNQGEARSVFVVVNFLRGPYSGALFEIKLNQRGEVHMGGGGVTDEPLLLEPVAKFPGAYCVLSARIFSCSYLLQEEGFSRRCEGKNSKSLLGYIFDTKTRSSYTFGPPETSKPVGYVVSAYSKLYYLASPVCCQEFPDPSFECYDPYENLWKRLPSFPFYRYLANVSIVGHAVCYGFILFSMDAIKQFQVVAFHVSSSKWHEVKVTSTYVPFLGRAVVVGESIYALSGRGDEIVAFSFKIDEGDEGGFAYSLSSPLRLRGLEIVGQPYLGMSTEYLVHLGNQDFCRVQTGENDKCVDCQYLRITTFQIVVGEGGSHMIKTLHSADFSVDINDSGSFSVSFSFTPECDDFEPKEEEGGVTAMNQTRQEEETKCKETTLDENLLKVEVKRCELDACQSTEEKGKAKKPSSDRKPKTWRI